MDNNVAKREDGGQGQLEAIIALFLPNPFQGQNWPRPSERRVKVLTTCGGPHRAVPQVAYPCFSAKLMTLCLPKECYHAAWR